MKRLIRHSAARFLTVGVLNTVVGLSIIYLAKYLGGLGDIAANVTGYSVGLLLSFSLNSKWTFRYDGLLLPAFWKFTVVFISAYLLNLACVLTAIRLGLNAYVAQALGIIPYTVFTYLVSRYFVFRSAKDS